MRLWSIHPKYLDTKGLVALWRESLLAQKVLLGKTKGYKNHPQLQRFLKLGDEKNWFLSYYLLCVAQEGDKRGYNFNTFLIKDFDIRNVLGRELTVTKGQLVYEFEHLQKKLWERDREWINKIHKLKAGTYRGNIYPENAEGIEPHPLFKVVEGDIEPWERVK